MIRRAHRAAWIIFNGDIPEGLNVLHKCDVALCVNPENLFLGTQKDNIIDCLKKGRMDARNKLKAEQVIAIRNEKILGCKKLAKIYNVNPTTIMEIRRRDTWSSLP